MDTAAPLEIVVNELVSNALKYAFPAGENGEGENGEEKMEKEKMEKEKMEKKKMKKFT